MIWKQNFCNVKNGVKLFEILKLQGVHHNIKVIQVLVNV
jgi:hypothetical protein